MGSSNVVVVRGSLSQVLSKLLAAKAVIANREASGYRVLQPDELYRIDAYADACGECLPNHGVMVRGDELLSRFPDALQLDDSRWALRIHGNSCRCEGMWTNRDDVLASRLAAEIEGVVG